MLRYSINYDFGAHTKFAAFYIQPNKHFSDVCRLIADNMNTTLDNDAKTLGLGWKMQGDSNVEEVKDITFSGRVYIYTVGMHDILELADITKYFRDKGMALQFRADDRALGAQENIRLGREKPMPVYVIRDNLPVPRDAPVKSPPAPPLPAPAPPNEQEKK